MADVEVNEYKGSPEHVCRSVGGFLTCDICFKPIRVIENYDPQAPVAPAILRPLAPMLRESDMADRDRTFKSFHPSTFEYLKPTDEQIAQMAGLRQATAAYAGRLDAELPEGPDKTFIMRSLRTLAMWINVCITRRADGSPRAEADPDA